MDILIVGGCLPHTISAREAANTVSYHIVMQLAKELGWNVSFCVVNYNKVEWPAEAIIEKQVLENAGVKFTDQILLHDKKVKIQALSKLGSLIFADPEYICRGAENYPKLLKLCEVVKPKIILTIWSEIGTAMAFKSKIPVFAYYGNPDPKTQRAFMLRANLKGTQKKYSRPIKFIYRKIHLRILERAHLKVMRSLKGLVNVAANDANYYKNKGVQNSSYLQNMWEYKATQRVKPRNDDKNGIVKIVGSIGNVDATGNWLGLWMLLEKLLPELKLGFGRTKFEIHIFGSGVLDQQFEQYKSDAVVKIRGFVDDIDSEIVSSDVFLVANNWHDQFKVGNTRFLHAWSLGVPCVTFEGSSEAMPELRHHYNVLMGKDPKEVARLILELSTNNKLSRTISENAFTTLKTEFAPEIVVLKLSKFLKNCL